MTRHLPEISPCPVCGKQPSISPCDDWPKDHGPAPWFAVCYGTQPIEHCIGGNGNSQREAMEAWNEDVNRFLDVPKGFALFCAKCGEATHDEVAFVNGEFWCHPCADALSHPSQDQS